MLLLWKKTDDILNLYITAMARTRGFIPFSQNGYSNIKNIKKTHRLFDKNILIGDSASNN